MRLGGLVVGFGLACAGCAGPTPARDASAPDAGADECTSPGLYDEQVLAGVTFSLRVPAGHRCDAPSALVVELVGAYDDAETQALDALAEAQSFVLARPLTEDPTAIEALVAELGARVPIDPARVDLIGSGDGARVMGTFLRRGTLVPRGVGLVDYVASLSENAMPIRDFGASRPRVWLSSGARSGANDAQRGLFDALGASGFDADHVRVRERDTGPCTPGWLYPELLDWLDRAAWPENGPPALPWVLARFDWPDAVILSLDAMPNGTFVAGALDGRVFGTNASDKWGLLAALGQGPLLDVVATMNAPLLASTRGMVRSDDGLAFSRDLGSDALVGLADRGDVVFGVTADELRVSDDRGLSWTPLVRNGRLEALACSPVTRTVIAVGQNGHYVRWLDDALMSATVEAIDARLHDVAAGGDGSFWAVGDDGAVLRSTDDGLSFARVRDPEGVPHGDLYAVAVDADGAMIAGGAEGTVLVSHDGATLVSWPTARQGLIGDVRWIGPGRGLIVGEPGFVASADGL
jgi:hypothetical protein